MDDAQVQHMVELLLRSLEAFRWESARPGVYRRTSGGYVVNNLVLHWCVLRYREGEGRKLLKESGERVAIGRTGHTGARGDFLSQHAIDLQLSEGVNEVAPGHVHH